jgi:hypothetical protein
VRTAAYGLGMKKIFIGAGLASVAVGGSVPLAVRAHSAASTIMLTIADRGRTVTVHPGDVIVVRLGSQPVLSSAGGTLRNEFDPWLSPRSDPGGVLSAVATPPEGQTSLPVVVGNFRADRTGRASIVAARSRQCADPEPCAAYPDFVVQVVVAG